MRSNSAKLLKEMPKLDDFVIILTLQSAINVEKIKKC